MADKIIDSISYTNKDFNSVYSELLDLVKKLTNKWDPSLSNESDPAVVLLKLNALIADKNNYNIDKNILECFPATVTQMKNARQLYNLLGYRMKHYQSASGNVTISIKNKNNVESAIIIDQFTQITDSKSNIKYTLLEDVNLSESNNYISEARVIEGTPQTYTINGNDLITLNNLDSNLRLYFTEYNIAENGIFISNNKDFFDTAEDTKPWVQVDNLATKPLNSTVYEFGILNSNTCYIQFPRDVANLFEDGIYIKYIVSSGSDGNIQARTLTSFTSDIKDLSDNVINDKLTIYQKYDLLNGLNPETIEDAYEGYKRTIGTFDTLVTKRDYENYLYNFKSNDNYIVSNIKTADRTNDINSVYQVQTLLNLNTPIKETIQNNVNTDDGETGRLSAFSLRLYALDTPRSGLISSDNADSDYETTYTAKDLSENITTSDFKQIKSLEHDFVPISRNDISVLENVCDVKGSVITYSKITKTEKETIEKNIKQAVYNNFNSRKVNYGEPFDYSKMIDVVKQSDPRIKTVVLNNLEYRPYIKLGLANASGYYLSSPPAGRDDSKMIKRYSILNGNMPAYVFDKSFTNVFGDVATNKSDVDTSSDSVSKINSISSYLALNLTADTPYLLSKNEVFQILEPTYHTDTEYTSNIYYNMNQADIDAIQKDTSYRLTSPVSLYWYDSESKQQKATLTAGTVIETNADLSAATDGKTSYDPKLKTGQYIRVKSENKVKLPIKTKYLFKSATENDITGTYILQDNEYFIYTDDLELEQIILGAGTKLIIPDGHSLKGLTDPLNQLLSDESINYKELDFELVVQEMLLTSIGEGYYIKCNKNLNIQFNGEVSGNKYLVTNNPNQIKDLDKGTTITYYPKTDVTNIIEIKNDAGDKYYRTRLLINCGPDSEQLIKLNHFITLNDLSPIAQIANTDTDTYIKFSSNVSFDGGENFKADVTTISGEEKELDFRKFKKNTLSNCELLSDGKVEISPDNLSIITSSSSKKLSLPFKFEANTSYLVAIQIDKSKESTLTCELPEDAIKISEQSSNDDLGGVYIYRINTTAEKNQLDLTISLGSASTKILGQKDIITISTIYKVLNDENIQYLIETGSTNPGGLCAEAQRFNFLYEIPDSDLIEDPTQADSFWHKSHIWNKWILPAINTKKFNITVDSSSILGR